MAETKNKNVLLWLVAIGFFMETLDSTIVNTALPTMAKIMGESPTSMQSVVISYSLTLAVLIPASGWLTDKFGTRKIYLLAIMVFTLGSLCCALSNTLPQLILSRILQGAGGSMLLPVGRLSILRNFPGQEYISALSFVAMPALIGPLLGPTLGGWLVEFTSWHWIFLINLPIGLIGCYATFLHMPDDTVLHPRKFDLVGFFQISCFMVSVSLALDGMSDLGFTPPIVMILFVFGLATLTAYYFHVTKTKEPLLGMEAFKVRTYSVGVLGNLFARLGSGGMPFLIPLYFQVCLGYSPFEAGLTMIPLSVAAILAKKVVGQLIVRMGYRSFLMINTVLVGVGIASFALISLSEPPVLRILQLFLFGTVNSMQFTAMNTVSMKDLGHDASSGGNTIFSMVQMLAMSFSVAAVGSLLHGFMLRSDRLQSFHFTFLCMGIVTLASTLIFGQLQKDEHIKRTLIEPV